MSPTSPEVVAPKRQHRIISIAALATLALSALAVACSDAPSAPAKSNTSMTASQSAALNNTSTLTPAQALMRTTPLAAPVVVVKTLSRGGGGITVPGTDFQLQVPNGAFAGKSMTFTITAYAGSAVAYDFQPHGVKFLKPLKAVQQLGHTNWKSFNLPAGYYQNWAGAYFADSTQIDPTTGLALVNEFMPGGVSVGGATMTWEIPHFSGYLISTGRE